MQSHQTLSLAAVLLAAFLCSPLPAAEIASRTVYRCDVGGVITFADRPCGSEAREYESDADRLNTYEAPPATRSVALPAKRPASARRSVASKSSTQERARHAADCERIHESLRDIRSKMRRGYGVKEGERLKERQAKLNARLKAGRSAGRCR